MYHMILLGVLAGGAYLMRDAQSKNEKARTRYKRETVRAVVEVSDHYRYAANTDALDKLYKVKKAKLKMEKITYKEIKQHKHDYRKMNHQLKESKEMLSFLFNEKKGTCVKKEKKDIQQNIDHIVAVRKELFGLKDSLKSDINTMYVNLKKIQQERKSIETEIDTIRNNEDRYLC